MMGTWEPLSVAMGWWIPLGIGLILASLYLWKAWGYRGLYPTSLLIFHFFYLSWFLMRGVSALTAHSYLSGGEIAYRGGLAFASIAIVGLSYVGVKDRVKRRAEEHADTVGPEALWSPEPIVGYRLTIHSFQNEKYRGLEATCRYSDLLNLPIHPDQAPSWSCRCGYYAYKQRMHTGSEFAVIVLMWGRVVEHEWGYRAQYMSPIGYWIGSPPVMASYSSIEGFAKLPKVTNDAQLDALIKSARESFDAAAPPPYDGGYYGYRETN